MYMENNYTKPFEWILDNRYRLLFHVLFWLVIYLDELLSIFGITPDFDFGYLVIEIIADMALVYFNLYILIPRFLFKNKIWSYSLVTALTLIANAAIMLYLYPDPDSSLFSKDFITNLLGTLLTTGSIMGTAIGVKIFKQFILNRQKVQDLQKANLQTELSYLKDQINPHFLFNSLNNIYVQSRKRPEEVPESILLLSDLLRYQLYDCSNDLVLLKDEIEYLKNYLKLDKMRKNGSDIQFNITGTPNGVKVAPFIFLPFVENAVKYSTTPNDTSFIKVDLDIKETKILFKIVNSYDNYENKHQGGIGQLNVRRRLELLYPERHKLSFSDENHVYSVDLELDL